MPALAPLRGALAGVSRLRPRWWVALALLAVAVVTAPARAVEKPVVLVFTSGRDLRAAEVIQTFTERVDFAVQMQYDLGDTNEQAYFVSDRIRGMGARLIFAVGDRALAAAAREFLLVPVVYANATETRFGLGRDDVVGVAPWPDPMTSVVRLHQAVPTLRRLGVIRYADDRGPYWEQLRMACDAAGVRLVTATVESREDVGSAATWLMRNADLLWMHDSPGMWSGSVLAEVLHEAWFRRFPVVGFALDQLSGPQPAALVLVSDPTAVGHAAADVARQILLEGIDPADLVAPRVESELQGNREALRHARLPVTRRTLAAFDGWAEP